MAEADRLRLEASRPLRNAPPLGPLGLLGPLSGAACAGSLDAYGCSPHYLRLQPPPPTVAASVTYGCSPCYLRLQPAQQLREIDYACLRQPAGYGGVPPGWHPAALPHHPHGRGPPHALPPGYGYPQPQPPLPHPHHPQHPHHLPMHAGMHGGALMAPPQAPGGAAGAVGGPMSYKHFMGLLEDDVSPEASQLKYQVRRSAWCYTR